MRSEMIKTARSSTAPHPLVLQCDPHVSTRESDGLMKMQGRLSISRFGGDLRVCGETASDHQGEQLRVVHQAYPRNTGDSQVDSATAARQKGKALLLASLNMIRLGPRLDPVNFLYSQRSELSPSGPFLLLIAGVYNT